MGNVSPIDALYVMLAALPGLFIAYRSKSGSGTGFFVLYVWLAGAGVAAWLGMMGFTAFAAAVLLWAVVFRKNLNFQKWMRRAKDRN